MVTISETLDGPVASQNFFQRFWTWISALFKSQVYYLSEAERKLLSQVKDRDTKILALETELEISQAECLVWENHNKAMSESLELLRRQREADLSIYFNLMSKFENFLRKD